MRRLDRYVGGTVLLSILLVLAIIVGLDALTVFIDESQKISESYTFLDVSFFVLLTLPGRIYEYVPFAALIGCLIGLGQLSSSSEIVVMRSAGVSIARLVWIVMQPTLLVAGSGFLIGEYVAPHTEQIAQSQRAIALSRGDEIPGSRGAWNREGDTYMSFNAVEAGGVVHGINLLQFDDKRQLQSALRAERAVFQGGFWTMEKVVETRFASWGTTQSKHTILRWDTGITPELLTMVAVAPEYLRIVDLYRYSRYLYQQGLDSDDYRLALWRKILQPLAIAGLVLVAISFIFGPLRDGTMGFRIFSGVLVGIVFRTLQDLLGPASLVFGFSPVYAALLPILICLVAGALMLRRAR
ncbi:MAG: LPS export ABC transporter permease LptG [Proteobacteria bacterium]|nr:LPS export ABC transporter permease LptG [Pseudomonadota bacterium]